jgi:hypothetical protein
MRHTRYAAIPRCHLIQGAPSPWVRLTGITRVRGARCARGRLCLDRSHPRANGAAGRTVVWVGPSNRGGLGALVRAPHVCDRTDTGDPLSLLSAAAPLDAARACGRRFIIGGVWRVVSLLSQEPRLHVYFVPRASTLASGTC